MNGKWTKRLLYGTVALVALLAVSAVIVPRTAQAFGPGGHDGGMRGGMAPGGMQGGFGGAHGGDRGALLAEALGISVDELEAAQAAAAQAGIRQAVDDERITQEQADLMLAGMKLRSYVDHQTILATALGLTPEELQAALEDGNLRDLIDELGLDRDTVNENMQAAMEAAIDQAVADGVITAEQAEALKEAKDGSGGRGGMKGQRGAGGFPGRGGEKQGAGGQRGFNGSDTWSGEEQLSVTGGNL